MARNLLTISYATRVLEAGSREQERLVALSQGLDRHVMVVVTNESAGLPREFRSGNLTVVATQSRSKIGKLLTALRLGKGLVRAEGGDWVVSAQDPFETGIVAYLIARSTKQAFHVQMHGDNFLNPYWLQATLFNRVRNWVGIRLVRRAAGVRVVAKRQQQAMARLGVPLEKITVLPVQVDLAPFLTVGAERTYELASTGPKFLYVGRFSPEKEVERIVRLFAEVVKQVPTASLTLLGDGQLRAKLKEYIAQKGLTEKVVFHPWTNDVAGVTARHDALVLLSQHEGFALVLLEAMAAGLPILTTDVGCVKDVCLPEKHCLVAPLSGDDEALARFVTLGSDETLRERLGKNGHQAANAFHLAQSNYQAAWTDSFFLGT